MNLQHVKQRRLVALKKCKSDRVLVSPAPHKSDLCMPPAETVASYLIEALRAGFTIEQFTSETGWTKPRIMTNLYKVAKKTGVGIQRRSERLFIVWPEDSNEEHFADIVMDGAGSDDMRVVAA